jgi:NADP-dependent alcohol dehydrogenase
MLNFRLVTTPPTSLNSALFGQGRIADLAKLVPAAAKVLILVGGASAEKTGTLAEVRAALGERQHATFTGIEPNPSYETSMQAVAQIREGGFDFLLAVGGGSVIDATKFIAAAVLFEGGDPWAILEKFGATCSAPCRLAPCSRCPPRVRR